ncbi:MAG: Ig-like domain-containing protein [Oscillospiraceae bacterium]|nr:Ig-like domain-containing protein [Oscillospiraceae bacterium]
MMPEVRFLMCLPHIAAPSDGSGNSIAVPSVGSVGAVSVPSASSKAQQVEITYVAAEGGQLQDTDKTKSSKIVRKVATGKEGAAVTAIANDGYTFVNWSDGSTTATRSDKATESKTLTANFKKKDTTVAVTGISLDKGNMDMTVGGVSHIGVTIQPNNATEKGYTVESSNTGVATAVDAGNNVVRVTAVAVGETTVTVTSKGNTNSKTSIKITVKTNEVAVTGLSLNPTTLNLTTGSSAVVSATITPADATNKAVTWATNNAAVATVSNGTVVAVSAGTATITATTANGISQTVAVTVADPAPQTYNVSASSADDTKGTVSASATGSVAKDTAVTFTANPLSGFEFSGWTITVNGTPTTSTQNPYTHTVDADVTVVAAFQEVTPAPAP